MFELGRSAPFLQAIVLAKGNAYSIWKIIDTDKKFSRQDFSEGLQPVEMHGDLEFVNVSFAYPSRPTVKVLNDISFKISAGETVAIVGETGSGKVIIFFSSFLIVFTR